MRHRLSRTAAGLVAGLATVCLLSLPAAANTATLSVDAGTFTFFNADDTQSTWVPPFTFAETGCGWETAALDATDTTATAGTLIGSLSARFPYQFLGNDYVVTLTATLTGTYDGNGTVVTLVAAATLTLDPSTGSGGCTKSSTINCSIALGDLFLSGATDAALESFGLGDTVTLDGSSGPFSLVVSTGCPGPLSAINDGYTTVTGLALTVTSTT